MFTKIPEISAAVTTNAQFNITQFDTSIDSAIIQPQATPGINSSIQVTVNGKLYNVSIKTGDFKTLETQLKKQVWWGKAALANTFAKAVGFSLGLVMLGAEAVGPLFPYDSDPGVAGTRVMAVPVGLPEGYDFRVPPQQQQFTWAVAVPVEPSSPQPLLVRWSGWLKLNVTSHRQKIA